ncbi:hypothetical protein [Paenibacillus mendelii]|uniref:Uncharacterized protein n=1 Tax=Paenibacillus mendelii TaxID=206163 RepID=A0ABV6J677_9BACL|nr:hypothetical protein [Paenibacillus mendelii]MCQ6559924.1 hypothetical protein [Paenibacillus mendelii]
MKAIETAGQQELEKAQLADKAAKEKEGSAELASSQLGFVRCRLL